MRTPNLRRKKDDTMTAAFILLLNSAANSYTMSLNHRYSYYGDSTHIMTVDASPFLRVWLDRAGGGIK